VNLSQWSSTFFVQPPHTGTLLENAPPHTYDFSVG